MFRDGTEVAPVYTPMTEAQKKQMAQIMAANTEMTQLMRKTFESQKRLKASNTMLKMDLNHNRVDLERMQAENKMRREALSYMKVSVKARQLRMIVMRNIEREATEMQSPKFRFLGTELLAPSNRGNLDSTEKYYDRLSSFGERVLRNPKFTKFIRERSRTKELRAEKKVTMKKNLKAEQKDRLMKSKLQLAREDEKRDQETKDKRELEAQIERDCGEFKKPGGLPNAYEHCRDRITAAFGAKKAQQQAAEVASKRVQNRRDFDFLSLGEECDKTDRCWMDEFLLAWANDSPWGATEGVKTITSVRRFEVRGGNNQGNPQSEGEIAFDGSSKNREGKSIARLPFHYFEGADPDMVSHFWQAAVRRTKPASAGAATLYSPWQQAVVQHLHDQWFDHLKNKLGGYLDERERDLQAREGGAQKNRQEKTGDDTWYAVGWTRAVYSSMSGDFPQKV